MEPARLPLPLCDLILWLTVAAMLVKPQFVLEFCFFAGLAGTSMAVLRRTYGSRFRVLRRCISFWRTAGSSLVFCIFRWSKTMGPLPGCVRRVMLALNGDAVGLGLFNWGWETN